MTDAAMQTLGWIEADRLELIPTKYWKAHEFCFYLHDQLTAMLTEYDASGIHSVVANTVAEVIEEHGLDLEDFDLIEFLKNHELNDEYRHHLIGQIALALTADMLHFLYEALRCIEKRKFSVAFSLLRKPLKEHTLYLAWLVADEESFIKSFEKDNYTSLNTSHLDKTKRVRIFHDVIAKLPMGEMFDAESIWEIIYSKQHPGSFEPTCQQATHLITSKSTLLRTQDFSFNFIFEDPNESYYYDFLYSAGKLPYVLIFVSQVCFQAFERIAPLNERTLDSLSIVAIGTYEALFSDGRSQHVTRMLTRELNELLKCIHCGEALKIGKRNAPEFYVSETVLCRKCGLPSSFPLYWVLSTAKTRIEREGEVE